MRKDQTQPRRPQGPLAGVRRLGPTERGQMSTAAKTTFGFAVLVIILSPFLVDSSDPPAKRSAPASHRIDPADADRPSRTDPPDKASARVPRAGPVLGVRIGVETLRNPYWYAAQGHQVEAEQFWQKAHWDRVLRSWAAEGYNYVLYWVEPWNKHAWQTFLIRHTEHTEARELTAAQSDKLIKHVAWIFGRARELGLKNLLFTYFIVTTPAFAKAHGMDRELPVSPAVDFRHNLKDMGYHFGVRNEATRKFTEAALAELFKTYKNLDGLYGAMGEAVPGKRSTWDREAVVPGLKRAGRDPLLRGARWMQPLDDFLEDMAPKEIYGKTWLAVHSNAEVFTDAKLYPTYARWLERAAVPAVVEVMHHNCEAGFPFNSPRLAWEVIREGRRF